MTAYAVDVYGSELLTLRDLLDRRHRYAPASPYRTRLRREARESVARARRARSTSLAPSTPEPHR